MLSIQFNIYDWVRIHRLHHNYTETDLDVHNVQRGLFFAHMGWLLKKKHPQFLRKLATYKTQDLLEDGVVMFNYK